MNQFQMNISSHIPESSTILIVDDERAVLDSLKALLTRTGYTVQTVQDASRAVETAKELLPDLLLLDIHMPGKSGLQIIREMKQDAKLDHIPIIIVTGVNDQSSRVEALQLGADDYLVKPPHIAELKARVKNLIKVKAFNDYLLDNKAVLEKMVEVRTQQLNDTVHELKQASYDTVLRLARAAEFRDEDTSFHLQRMGGYAGILAREVGFSSEEAQNIQFASLVHDIGKMGVPDNILMKPGKLTAEEWVVMKKHPEFGAHILDGTQSDLLKMGKMIALTHHERWDGKGYPEGLEGEEIPIEGRIAAIADVFDALSSDRVYRKAFSIEQSFSILLEERGTHFDPELLDAFIAMKPKILEIIQKYRDQERLTG